MGYILVVLVAIVMLEYAKEEKNGGGALMGCFAILMLLGAGITALEFVWKIVLAIWIPVIVIVAVLILLWVIKLLIGYYVNSKSIGCRQLKAICDEVESISDVENIKITEYGIAVNKTELPEEVFFVDYHDKIQANLNLIKHNEEQIAQIRDEVQEIFQENAASFSKRYFEKNVAMYYAKKIELAGNKLHSTFDAEVSFLQEGQPKKICYTWDEILTYCEKYEELSKSLKEKRLVQYEKEQRQRQQEMQLKRNEEIEKRLQEQKIKLEEERRKEEIKKERSKLSASLRYDVLKRDNFRCTICGRSASDGVTLHVDHIKPVSKGGKTEMSNLRTLCDYCNLGKSDKYDPNGMN